MKKLLCLLLLLIPLVVMAEEPMEPVYRATMAKESKMRAELSTKSKFEAVLGLELQLDQWEVHQTSGVKYAPVNFDCAVGGGKDLRFTNTLDYPIRMEVRTQNGALTAYFYRAE